MIKSEFIFLLIKYGIYYSINSIVKNYMMGNDYTFIFSFLIFNKGFAMKNKTI
jgi:hypothetical protein